MKGADEFDEMLRDTPERERQEMPPAEPVGDEGDDEQAAANAGEVRSRRNEKRISKSTKKP